MLGEMDSLRNKWFAAPPSGVWKHRLRRRGGEGPRRSAAARERDHAGLQHGRVPGGVSGERPRARRTRSWEYVVVDNCSTDGSLEIARAYEARDSRIRVVAADDFVGVRREREPCAAGDVARRPVLQGAACGRLAVPRMPRAHGRARRAPPERRRRERLPPRGDQGRRWTGSRTRCPSFPAARSPFDAARRALPVPLRLATSAPDPQRPGPASAIPSTTSTTPSSMTRRRATSFSRRATSASSTRC